MNIKTKIYSRVNVHISFYAFLNMMFVESVDYTLDKYMVLVQNELKYDSEEHAFE